MSGLVAGVVVERGCCARCEERYRGEVAVCVMVEGIVVVWIIAEHGGAQTLPHRNSCREEEWDRGTRNRRLSSSCVVLREYRASCVV